MSGRRRAKGCSSWMSCSTVASLDLWTCVAMVDRVADLSADNEVQDAVSLVHGQ